MIDVIIPAFNAHNTLSTILIGLAKQSIKDKLKITIVDDGSKYGYDEIINNLNLDLSINIIKIKRNRGAAYARQFGLNKTKNDYVLFLDADDELVNYKVLECMYNIISNDIKCNLVYAKEIKNNKCYYHHYHLVAKIMRRSIIDKYKLKFKKLKIEEDIAFMMSYLTVIDSNSIILVDRLFYKYNKNISTSTTYNYGFLLNYDYKEFFKAVDYAYKYAKKYRKYDFFKNDLLSIFLSIIKNYYKNVNCINKNLIVEGTFLKRCQRFYNKYKNFLNILDKKDSLEIEDKMMLKWFLDIINLK